MNSDRIEASKIFIWGQVGDSLKRIDPDRMLAVAQQDPDYHLSIKANSEISEIVKKIKALEGKKITADVKNDIVVLNRVDNTFREISKFFQYSPDMLSIGSFITGEMEKKKAFMELFGD